MMKFCKSEVFVWERDLMYSITHEHAFRWILVPGYVCEEEPSIAIHKDRKKHLSLGWKVTILDAGRFSNTEHVGKLITYRKTLKEAKKVVEIIHENTDEFYKLIASDSMSEPEWLIEVRYGDSNL